MRSEVRSPMPTPANHTSCLLRINKQPYLSALDSHTLRHIIQPHLISFRPALSRAHVVAVIAAQQHGLGAHDGHDVMHSVSRYSAQRSDSNIERGCIYTQCLLTLAACR